MTKGNLYVHHQKCYKVWAIQDWLERNSIHFQNPHKGIHQSILKFFVRFCANITYVRTLSVSAELWWSRSGCRECGKVPVWQGHWFRHATVSLEQFERHSGSFSQAMMHSIWAYSHAFEHLSLAFSGIRVPLRARFVKYFFSRSPKYVSVKPWLVSIVGHTLRWFLLLKRHFVMLSQTRLKLLPVRFSWSWSFHGVNNRVELDRPSIFKPSVTSHNTNFICFLNPETTI